MTARSERQKAREAATSPSQVQQTPNKDSAMNIHSDSTAFGCVPLSSNPADDVNRAKAIVLTVWLALQSSELSGGCEGDIGAIGDTLYEAYQRLQRAEKGMGVHQ